MYKYFSKESFEKWMGEHDYFSLKTAVVNVMRNDPTFSTGEFDEIVSILNEKAPDIFEDYELQAGEEPFVEDQKKWTPQYFTTLTFWFGQNFALSREENIKRVGQKVYVKNPSAQISSPNFPQPPKQELKTAPKEKTKGSLAAIIGAIAAIGALVAILIKLFK